MERNSYLMNSTLKIINGTVLTPFRTIKGATVVVKNGKIAEISTSNPDLPDALEIDASGQYVAPGFIDMHVHGGGGYDFMDGTEEAFLLVAEAHAQHGTTAMLPTTLTAEVDELLRTLDTYRSARLKNKSGAAFLGIHLEGPYFAMNQRGAQDPRYIRAPEPEEYLKILDYSSDIRRWSAAPELDGAIRFGREIKKRGILLALAHTDATYEEVLAGFENGYSLATHFYSCMSGVSRRKALRYAGAIEAAYLIDDMDVEIIADGVHLPAPLLKLIYKIKGVDRTALITDAMRAAGTDFRQSILGSLHDGLEVVIEDGVAKLPDRTSLAGSIATTDRLVRTMVDVAEIPLLDAVRMMTQVPARILGVDDTKGVLLPGKDADIVIFDEKVQIDKTIIGGRIVYEQKAELIP